MACRLQSTRLTNSSWGVCLMLKQLNTSHKRVYHDENQVGQASQGLVFSKSLHQCCDVLLGVRSAHGKNGRLVGVAQVAADLLQVGITLSARLLRLARVLMLNNVRQSTFSTPYRSDVCHWPPVNMQCTKP